MLRYAHFISTPGWICRPIDAAPENFASVYSDAVLPLIQHVKVHVDRYRQLTLPVAGRMTEVIAEHEPILAAIEAHDPQRAGIAMERHLDRLLLDISETQHTNPEYFASTE